MSRPFLNSSTTRNTTSLAGGNAARQPEGVQLHEVFEDRASGRDASRPRSGWKKKWHTTLEFSSGSQSPPAYLPCEDESECTSNPTPLQSIIASFRGFIVKRLEGVPERNRP